MKITELPFSNRACLLEASQLPRLSDDWLLECEFRQISPATIEKYRVVLGKLDWFLKSRSLATWGKRELQQFLLYLRNGHSDEHGRWGNSRLTKAASAGTTATYFRVLSTFCQFLIKEGVIDLSPLHNVPKPIDRPDQVAPFTMKQVRAMIGAAKRSRNPVRDEAIILFLLDTGLRASELCGLNLVARFSNNRTISENIPATFDLNIGLDVLRLFRKRATSQYFATVFKSMTGVTPKHYRESANAKYAMATSASYVD